MQYCNVAWASAPAEFAVIADSTPRRVDQKQDEIRSMAMTLTSRVREEGDLLIIEVAGDFSIENMRAGINLIRDEVTRRGRNRVLVDAMKIGSPPTTMIELSTGVYTAEVLGGDIRIAFLHSSAGITKFGENVAVNRGATGLRVVGSMEEALAWLRPGE